MLADGDVVDIAEAEFRHVEKTARERLSWQEKFVLLDVLRPRENRMAIPADRRFEEIGVRGRPGMDVVLAPGERRLPIPVVEFAVVDRRGSHPALVLIWFQLLGRADVAIAGLEGP